MPAPGLTGKQGGKVLASFLLIFMKKLAIFKENLHAAAVRSHDEEIASLAGGAADLGAFGFGCCCVGGAIGPLRAAVAAGHGADLLSDCRRPGPSSASSRWCRRCCH